jgi:DNA-directed RNA polymerase subunit RPC12/RpoP
MKCGQCGGKLRRVHRTFWERFSYMAIYECRKCEREEFAPRRYRYHLGPNARCPICGSYRVVKLKHPDRIDRMHGGFLNLVERIAGKGKLFHCRWCRLQFYDRRELADNPKHAEPVTSAVSRRRTTEPDTESAAPPQSAGPAT